jgi:hypothetical protein
MGNVQCQSTSQNFSPKLLESRELLLLLLLLPKTCLFQQKDFAEILFLHLEQCSLCEFVVVL